MFWQVRALTPYIRPWNVASTTSVGLARTPEIPADVSHSRSSFTMGADTSMIELSPLESVLIDSSWQVCETSRCCHLFAAVEFQSQSSSSSSVVAALDLPVRMLLYGPSPSPCVERTTRWSVAFKAPMPTSRFCRSIPNQSLSFNIVTAVRVDGTYPWWSSVLHQALLVLPLAF